MFSQMLSIYNWVEEQSKKLSNIKLKYMFIIYEYENVIISEILYVINHWK